MESEKFQQIIFNPDLLNPETADELKKLTEEYPWFQMAWMLYAKNLKNNHSEEYNAVVKNVAVRISNRKQLFKFLNSESEKQSHRFEINNSFSLSNEREEEVGFDESDSLIDKFLMTGSAGIRRNPDIDNNEGNHSHIDVLKKSTAENDGIITETLAGIYFQQKNYEKALNAYQKLSLKYPEKSVYFATRIKEIEDLKNIN